ncbi:hypothetical protein [Cupriavidus necator]
MSHDPLLPSGRRRGLPFVVPDDWTPEQALAVFELLDDLREVVCSRYLHQIQDLMRKERRPANQSREPGDAAF